MRFGIFVEVQVQLQQTIRASEVTLSQQFRNGCRNKLAALRTGYARYLR